LESKPFEGQKGKAPGTIDTGREKKERNHKERKGMEVLTLGGSQQEGGDLLLSRNLETIIGHGEKRGDDKESSRTV